MNMQPLSLLRPHNRWSGRLHAYIDGELHADAIERFKEHLAECAECAYAVADARNLKQLLHALPEIPAPRSFKLTAAMVAPQTAPLRLAPLAVQGRTPRRLTPAIRFAQVAAGLAVLGLVAAGTADLVGGGQSATQSSSKSAAPEESARTTNQDVASASAPQDTGARTAASATTAAAAASVAPAGTPAAVVPATGGSGAGAAGGLPTPSPTDGGAYSYGESPPDRPNVAAVSPEPPAAALAAPSPQPVETTHLASTQPTERAMSDRTLHGVELLLGGLLAASVAAWLFMRTKGQQ